MLFGADTIWIDWIKFLANKPNIENESANGPSVW